jgi:predicted transcriptional regulator of viral defense system
LKLILIMPLTKKIILASLRKMGANFFTVSDICSLFGISNNYASQMVYQLKMDKKIEEIEKGKYTLPEGVNYPFLIASKTVQPSYISFETALSVYRAQNYLETETYYVATPKRKRPIVFKKYNFKYITLKPYKFFGFCQLNIDGNKVTMAEPEKAIVDCLEETEYRPELFKFREILEELLDYISIKKMIKYAVRCQNKSLIARLGYILETLGVDISIKEKYLPKDYVKFDPSGDRQGKWLAKWNIIDNL